MLVNIMGNSMSCLLLKNSYTIIIIINKFINQIKLYMLHKFIHSHIITIQVELILNKLVLQHRLIIHRFDEFHLVLILLQLFSNRNLSKHSNRTQVLHRNGLETTSTLWRNLGKVNLVKFIQFDKKKLDSLWQ